MNNGAAQPVENTSSCLSNVPNELENQRSDNHQRDEATSAPTQKIIIWTRERHTAAVRRDKTATLVFIGKTVANFYGLLYNMIHFQHTGMVKEKWALLNDNVTKNRHVWESIAKAMSEPPYNYDLGKSPRTKIEQKWQNLQSSYKDHLKEEGGTGKGLEVEENAPPYFLELQEFLGNLFIGSNFKWVMN